MYKRAVFFLTIDTTLPGNDPLRFRKNLFHSYKNDSNWSSQNFRQNFSTVWLKKAAKISALSSGNLDKYAYLTGEDLNYKPSSVDQAKFDYFSLSKFFNKGLKEEVKKEGLLKRLKNIEGKNEEQLRAIKYQGEKQLAAFKKIIN